jgi:hypothetical protein
VHLYLNPIYINSFKISTDNNLAELYLFVNRKQRIRAIKNQRHSAQAKTSASRNLKTLPIHRTAYRGGRLLGNKRLKFG